MSEKIIILVVVVVVIQCLFILLRKYILLWKFCYFTGMIMPYASKIREIWENMQAKYGNL